METSRSIIYREFYILPIVTLDLIQTIHSELLPIWKMKSRTLQRGYQQYYLMQVTKVNINFDSCVHGYVLKNFQGHKNDNLHQQAPPQHI